MLIQLLISCVALVGLIGVVRRFKKGALSRVEFSVWIVFWIAAGLIVWNPSITNRVAGLLGVGRGADAVFYLAIVVLFYTVFRLFGRIEHLEHQLSELVKKIALRDIDLRNNESPTNTTKNSLT